MEKYYLEYRILKNRLGLLGDITSILGMLGINILLISSLSPNRRAFLVEVPTPEHLTPLKSTLGLSENLEVLELHPPNYLDLLAMRHGRKILATGDPPTYHFHRGELDVLIDFIAQTVNEKHAAIIGIQGPPRVGKTEVAIASCVQANKRWVLISSTFLRQVAREKISKDYKNIDTVLIIDALTSMYRASSAHKKLLLEVLSSNQPKIIEHPQVLINELGWKTPDFTTLIHLKGEEEGHNKTSEIDPVPFSSFDIS